MDPLEIVERAGPYSIVEDLMHTKANITFGQLLGNPTYCKSARKSMVPKKRIPRVGKGVKRTKSSNLSQSTKDTTPLICKAKIAGYSFDLILDSGSSVSVIAKPFLDAIARKIDGPSKRAMSSVHREKKKAMGIAKDIPVVVDGVTIAANMEVIDTDNYVVIVGNGWLEEAEALINYKTCQMTLQCVSPPVIVQCQHTSKEHKIVKNTSKQEEELEDDSDEDSEEESDSENETHAAFTIFSDNGNVQEETSISYDGIRINGSHTLWIVYD
jgi:hypothetical protein